MHFIIPVVKGLSRAVPPDGVYLKLVVDGVPRWEQGGRAWLAWDLIGRNVPHGKQALQMSDA